LPECTAAYSALAASRIAIGLALPSFPLSTCGVSDFDETWCEWCEGNGLQSYRSDFEYLHKLC